MRLTALAIAVLCSGCAMSPSERAWQTMHAIDVAQTLNGPARDPCYIESAWTRHLIGERPSPESVIAWGVATAVAHYHLGRWLEDSDWPDGVKATIRSIDFGRKAYVVAQNHREGVRVFGDNARTCL